MIDRMFFYVIKERDMVALRKKVAKYPFNSLCYLIMLQKPNGKVAS